MQVSNRPKGSILVVIRFFRARTALNEITLAAVPTDSARNRHALYLAVVRTTYSALVDTQSDLTVASVAVGPLMLKEYNPPRSSFYALNTSTTNKANCACHHYKVEA